MLKGITPSSAVITFNNNNYRGWSARTCMGGLCFARPPAKRETKLMQDWNSLNAVRPRTRYDENI
jgi:hypothetical protein